MSEQRLFKALADPTRRKILQHLRSGSQTAGEISELFDISRASLSHHFNILKAADLVRSEHRGQHRVYSLNTSVAEDFAQLVLDLIGTSPKEGDS